MLKKSIKHGSSLWLTVLLLSAAVLFLPSLRGGFVGLDDRIITDNPLIRQLTPGSIFHTFVPKGGLGSSYQPLRSLAFSVIYAIQGNNPAGFLLLNLLLYLANIYLFYRFAILLFSEREKALPLAALTASVLFAVHPVHVEAVSWHQGGKVTLMAIFYLWSLISYFRFRAGDGGRYYWFCLLAFVASMMSQPAAVSLPLVIVIWELLGTPGVKGQKTGNGKSRIMLQLAPFFLPAAALAVHLIFFSTVRLGAGVEGDAPLAARLMFLPVVLGKSLLKLLLPVNICARYPLDVPSNVDIWPVLGWLVFCTAAGWAVVRISGNRKLGWFLLLLFVATSLPTSGLVETSTLLADRYLYLPGMALCLAAGLGFGGLNQERKLFRPVFALLVLTVAGLTFITLERQADWRGRVSLWSRVVAIYPGHSLGQFNLADAYSAQGVNDKAIEHYYRALEIKPDYGDAYANLSTLVLKQGRTDLARQLIGKAIELRPDRAEVWIKNGIIMASINEDSLAETSFRRAVEIDDGWSWAGYLNLGMLYAGRGDSRRAASEFQLALDAALASGRPAETVAMIRSVINNTSAMPEGK